MVKTRSNSVRKGERTDNNMEDQAEREPNARMDNGCDVEGEERSSSEDDTDCEEADSVGNGEENLESGEDHDSEGEEATAAQTENTKDNNKQSNGNGIPMSEADCEQMYQWLLDREETNDSDPEVKLGKVSKKKKVVPRKDKRRREKAPDRFKGGSQSWDDYWKTFCEVAKWNNWDRADKADALRMHVQGEAAEYVHDLKGYAGMSIEKLHKAMMKRFGDGRHMEADKSALRNRKKKLEETYEQLAQSIRRLAQRVYRKDEELAESAACETFIRAIQDPEIKKGVAVARPTTLRDCVDQAIYIDDFLVGDNRVSSPTKVKVRNVVDEDYIRQVVSRIGSETAPQYQARQVGYMNPREKEQPSMARRVDDELLSLNNSRGRGKRKDWSNVECYSCHEYGHIARACPERKRENNNGSQWQRNDENKRNYQRGNGRQALTGRGPESRSDQSGWGQNNPQPEGNRYQNDPRDGNGQSFQRGGYRGRPGRGYGRGNPPRRDERTNATSNWGGSGQESAQGNANRENEGRPGKGISGYQGGNHQGNA
jgi:hypothetical protein